MIMDKIFMGIDASSTCTGVSIFINNKLEFYEAIRGIGNDWRERLYSQKPELTRVINEYKPQRIYMEDVPLKSGGGLKTLVILGGVQGFIYDVAATANVPVEYVAPTVWRSMGGLFDGTKEGKKREVLKQKAIQVANEKFNLDLKWVSPSSKKNDDDIAEAILICAVMLGIVSKEKKFGKKRSNSILE